MAKKWKSCAFHIMFPEFLHGFGQGGNMPDPAAFGMPGTKDLFRMAMRSSLPEQHEDQLALGFRMIQNAYNSKAFRK